MIYGVLPLAAAFVGVWSGREVTGVELRAQQEMTRLNSEAIRQVANSVMVLTIQVEKILVTLPREVSDINGRMKIIEIWQVGIQEDRTKRGEIIPAMRADIVRLERKVESLERRAR